MYHCLPSSHRVLFQIQVGSSFLSRASISILSGRQGIEGREQLFLPPHKTKAIVSPYILSISSICLVLSCPVGSVVLSSAKDIIVRRTQNTPPTPTSYHKPSTDSDSAVSDHTMAARHPFTSRHGTPTGYISHAHATLFPTGWPNERARLLPLRWI